MKLILASQSPRRKELLSGLGVNFTSIPADIDEILIHSEGVSTAEHNSHIKAQHIAKSYPNDLILGSDTIVELGDKVLGKPTDIEDAKATLRSLSNKEHEVITAVTLICLENSIDYTFTETTKVKFKKLTEEAISEYLSKVNTLDKAGSYAIQSHRELIVESFEGFIDNVIGLPTHGLKQAFKELNISLTDFS